MPEIQTVIQKIADYTRRREELGVKRAESEATALAMRRRRAQGQVIKGADLQRAEDASGEAVGELQALCDLISEAETELRALAAAELQHRLDAARQAEVQLEEDLAAARAELIGMLPALARALAKFGHSRYSVSDFSSGRFDFVKSLSRNLADAAVEISRAAVDTALPSLTELQSLDRKESSLVARRAAAQQQAQLAKGGSEMVVSEWLAAARAEVAAPVA